ncbi:DUF2510 domain-containing protein, partial [Streptomyces triticirhizae]
MSLPPAGNASGGPGPNWYPDPSIPGYIRYWDGQTWVAGSSRPEPREGEPLPAPPAAGASSGPPAQGDQNARGALPVRQNRAEIAASRDQHVGGGRPDEDVSTSPVAAAGRVDPRGQFVRTPSEGSEPPPAVPQQSGGRPKDKPESRNEQTFGLRQADLPQQRPPAASSGGPAGAPAGGPPGLGLPGAPNAAAPSAGSGGSSTPPASGAQQQPPASGGPAASSGG